MKANVVDMGLVPYPYAQQLQQELSRKRRDGEIGDTVLLLEHPPVVTVGTKGKAENLLLTEQELSARGIALYRTDRGGDVTYHGPGQLVIYPIFDLTGHGRDIHRYAHNLEEVGIRTAHSFGLDAGRRPGKAGVWCGEQKVASLGVSVRRWVTRHGLALNVDPDLSHFATINPCGMESGVMSSLAALCGRNLSVREVVPILLGHLAEVFGLELERSGMPAPEVGHPPWLRVAAPDGDRMEQTRALLDGNRLETVCQEADCPNAGECFSRGVATFLILGSTCTRHCRFCAVQAGSPLTPDPDEPRRIADAAVGLDLKHIVVTSVTRDDLPDGGAGPFADTIRELHCVLPEAVVEVLVPDFQGDPDSLAAVLEANPHVLAHNLETVPRLYPEVRPGAGYQRSLALLARAKALRPSLTIKSGLMVGLGETVAEVQTLMGDLRDSGCDILTIGQYLAPSPQAVPVQEFITPALFLHYERMAKAMGFASVVSGPLVRSSYAAAA